jgi:hypothetical protein
LYILDNRLLSNLNFGNIFFCGTNVLNFEWVQSSIFFFCLCFQCDV